MTLPQPTTPAMHMDLCIMLVCRKRGRVVEGTSLENWRRVKLFVSSNLTASAKILNKSPTSWGFFSSSHLLPSATAAIKLLVASGSRALFWQFVSLCVMVHQ